MTNSITPTRTALVQHARMLLGNGADSEGDVLAVMMERHGLDADEARGVVSEAQRSTAERPHNTDAGNAARLAEHFGDRIRYVYEHRQWLAWDGARWAPDATGAVERYAKETVRRMYAEAAATADDDDRERAAKWALVSESATRLEAMMKLARSDERIVIRADALDADPWALNVQNGTIDLRTGALRAHDPAEMHSKMAAAEFDPDAPRKRWESFLAEALPDPEVRRFVQKLVGYSLTGEVGENVLAFPYGSGGNGKSVFLGAIRRTLGDYATEAAPDLLVARRERGIPVDIIDLRGFRFVTTMEVEGGRKMATDVMKRITGERTLKARKMRQNFETFENVTKLWMAANDRPEVDGLDEAVWRRVRLIPFTVTVREPGAPGDGPIKDPGLEAKLAEEAAGILAWAVDGCLAWQREGLTPPAAVLAATDEYRDSSNPLAEWFEAECEADPEAVTPATQLRDSYERWCRYRTKPIPARSRKWSEGLIRLGCQEARPYIDGKRVRAWQGVRLRGGDSGGLGL